jgi:hypothetical protein
VKVSAVPAMHGMHVIPMHHDMLAGNQGFPEHAVAVVRADYPELGVFVPARFRPFVFAAPGT